MKYHVILVVVDTTYIHMLHYIKWLRRYVCGFELINISQGLKYHYFLQILKSTWKSEWFKLVYKIWKLYLIACLYILWNKIYFKRFASFSFFCVLCKSRIFLEGMATKQSERVELRLRTRWRKSTSVTCVCVWYDEIEILRYGGT